MDRLRAMTDPGPPATGRRVLFLAPNWLGDAVMAAPVLSALRTAFAAAKIPLFLTWAVRRTWAPLFVDDPRIDAILPVERHGRHRGTAGVFRLGHDLRAARADAILLGPPSFRAGAVAMLSGARERIGYRGDGRSWLLTSAVPVPVRGAMHYTQEMLVLVGELLRRWNLPTPVGGDLTLDGDSLPACESWAAQTSSGPPLWALGPGTTFGPAKNWPLRHVAAFIEQAVLQRGRRVVLLGDRNSARIVERLRGAADVPFRQQLDGPAGVIDRTGKTDLQELVSLLKSCEGYVGNDSGLMHLAGALGCPTVGIFGSSNPDWTRPGGRNSTYVTADGFQCSPCYRPTCEQPEFCLETIEPGLVLAKLEACIAAAASRRDS